MNGFEIRISKSLLFNFSWFQNKYLECLLELGIDEGSDDGVEDETGILLGEESGALDDDTRLLEDDDGGSELDSEGPSLDGDDSGMLDEL